MKVTVLSSGSSRLDAAPVSDNEKRVTRDVATLHSLLGEDCLITVRRLHPACSTLISVGEFATAAAIVADPDPDGLTGAAKAAGLYYPEWITTQRFWTASHTFK